jgi:hypothetical protein
MKGCLAVVGGIVVIGIIVIVGGGVWFGTKMAKFSKEIEAAFAQLDSTNQDFPFAKPATSQLDPGRLDTVLAIRSRVAQGSRAVMQQFEQIERSGDVSEAFDAMKDMFAEMKTVPQNLETELRAARISYDEFVWTVDTAYGTVFAAADQGNPQAVEAAKQIESMIVDATMPGAKSEEKFASFRNRAKASLIALDPATLDIVLARKEQLAGDKAYTMFDFFLSGRGEDIKIQEK